MENLTLLTKFWEYKLNVVQQRPNLVGYDTPKLFVDLAKVLACFWSMVQFYTHCKHQKTKGFLVFPGGINWKHSPEKR